jgi:hypothetical protein
LELRLQRPLLVREVRRRLHKLHREPVWSDSSASVASTLNSLSAAMPWRERPGPPQGRLGSVKLFDPERADGSQARWSRGRRRSTGSARSSRRGSSGLRSSRTARRCRRR